jgi:hypothetical protein
MEKTITSIIFILFFQISFSQTENIKKDTLNSKDSNVFFKKFESNIFSADKKLVIKPLNVQQNKNLISVYNPTTGLNDNYVFSKDTITIEKSILINELNFRGQKMDSFNPSGLNNVGWALFAGFYNLLFEKK